jgi:hypothetical protein
MVKLLLVPAELVKRIETLRAAVLNILYMRPVHTLFGLPLGMWSIVDIRILAFVAGLIARHAWIPPQRTALAGRRGQRYYVVDHCWAVLCFQKTRGCCIGLFVFGCNATVRVPAFAFRKLGRQLAIRCSNIGLMTMHLTDGDAPMRIETRNKMFNLCP